MSARRPVEPAPGPLERYAAGFDEVFTRRSQRHGFRRYLEGLLMSSERNKTLTGLANTAPVTGAIQRGRAAPAMVFVQVETVSGNGDR